MNDLVSVSDLTIVANDASGKQINIVDGISFSIAKGEVLALIGESGSGKTTIALALMGYVRSGCRIANGSISVANNDITAMTNHQLSALRGSRITYIAQSAASAFNPSRTIMDQVIEPAIIHQMMNKVDAQKKAIDLFNSLGLPEPDSIGRRYPHQVSGGQLQRLMAAMALITDPELVVFDEPTTALDVTTQVDVLRVFKSVIKTREISAVYVSHDLAVVAQMADQILVLKDGQMIETGLVGQVITEPEAHYTQSLMAAAHPSEQDGCITPENTDSLLTIQGLSAGYGKISKDGVPEIPVLSNIDLNITPGSTIGLIGESGSGKSTLARVVAGLVAPVAGSILLDGKPLPKLVADRSKEELRRIQIIFQNADTSLNPAHTVERILARPLVFYHGMRASDMQNRVHQLLDLVRLPKSIATRPCAGLSGGQKQRINLARALAANPDIILCDEITSALDTVVAAAILDLMADLRKELQVSYLFISHDISTVQAVCDEVAVLYNGQKVEQGSRQTFKSPPYHPYTDALIASVPELELGWLENTKVSSMSKAVVDTASVAHDLCGFLDRCPVRIDGLCDAKTPPRKTLAAGNQVLCHIEKEGL